MALQVSYGGRQKCNGKLHHMWQYLRGAVCECRTAMSHHSDEQSMLTVTSDSFWEPGNYKRTTRRVDDGHRLCGELQALVQERADIEKTYAKSLRGWAKKWNDLIEKGPEYGTMEAAWKGGMVEAERLSDLHLAVRDRLVNDVIAQIKNWQKDTYHKSMIQLKERKEMDEAFKKAQKPWAKLLQKVERTRLEYHTACKQERTAQNQERNAGGDSSLSPDQVKKMAERVSKCREEVSKSREKYQAALAEITAYNPRYIEDMSGVFERCQQMEAQRLTFFKDVLFSFHKCLNISQEPTLPQLYEEFHHTINNADHQKDLKWWANNHGVNMAMAWPQFEELPPITNNKMAPKANHEPPANHNNTANVNNTNNIKKETISAPIAVTNGTASAPKSNKSSPAKEPPGKPQENPFEEDEWDEESGGALTDTGEPGQPVRALYDYTGAESDELSFRQGDLFEKLEDEDEQGWCKGRKDGRVGLYPANYVEPVGH
ncbi:protein kinase C and casein kinase substrate in neurons protein 1 isoform X3 [Leguminivora glycinivorella]|uniref:protein kinase C and casein kinase substrate in neurons protein 1 isoform X3 n=1 Tax=Leguminivora glycinivorella TaxID=1035111 RepID=UPI0020100AED|nr:protein kinase C and casein kinase substrate in neurons protein 1 isoform X3 [Leguminivora glycinivorella]